MSKGIILIEIATDHFQIFQYHTNYSGGLYCPFYQATECSGSLDVGRTQFGDILSLAG